MNDIKRVSLLDFTIFQFFLEIQKKGYKFSVCKKNKRFKSEKLVVS